MFKQFIVNSYVIIFLSLTSIHGFANSISDQKKGFDELASLLASFKQFEASFQQKSFDKDMVEIQALAGNIKLQKPDHFYWKSNEPSAQLLVCDGKSIWHFDTDLEQVVIQDYASQVSQAPILVVIDDPARLIDTYKLEKIVRGPNLVSFFLIAIDETATLKNLTLTFTDEKLSGLDFTDSLQQKTQTLFHDVSLNKPIQASFFSFEVPPGVDVLHE